MAKNITDQEVGEITLLEGAGVGLSKIASEELGILAGLGTGNFTSGGAKILTSVGVSMATNNRNFRVVTTGMLVDGMEDMFLSVRRYINGRQQVMSDSENSTADATARVI